MASSGKHVAAMGSTQKESKKTVECGICGHNARRDYLKGTHFPKMHPGERYKEKGEKTLTFDARPVRVPNPAAPAAPEAVDNPVNDEEVVVEHMDVEDPGLADVVSEGNKDEEEVTNKDIEMITQFDML